ncbi:hypothetical protein FRB99_006209 [Tulasnella sp. 403]|nr:hypothetical protein FRB99_006209 [Tulasnella sp. 403]
MKPPSEAALQQAAETLLGSLYKENGICPSVPSEDSMVELDECILRIQTVVDAFANAMSRRSLKLKRFRNNCVRIHNLPGEIFIHILSLFLDFSATNLVDELRNLASVSRYWFDTIISSPTLWAHISNEYSTSILELFLRKSGSAPLNVHYRERYSNTWAFWERMEPHLPRLSTLEYKAEHGIPPSPTEEAKDSSDSPAQIEKDEPPTSVQLVCYREGDAKVVSIPQHSALRRVSFEGGRLVWGSCHLSRLRNLQLYNMNQHSGTPSFSCILSMIASSPELEVLILCDLESNSTDVSNGWADVRSAENDCLTLPGPKLFGFTRIPRQLSTFLLSHLSPSRYRHICADDVPLSFANTTDQSIRTAMASLLRIGRPIHVRVWTGASEDPRVELENFQPRLYPYLVYHEHWGYSTEANDGIGLTFKTPNVMELLDNVTSLIGDATTTVPVTISFDNPERSTPASLNTVPTSIFHHLPNLTSLRFKSQDIDVAAALRYLAAPQSDQENQTHWLCPLLTELTVSKWEMDLEETADFVKSRWGVSQPSDSSAGGESDTRSESDETTKRPTKLHTFDVETSTADRDEVKAAVKPAIAEQSSES